MTEWFIDACSIIAFLNDEEGADIVENLLDQATSEENTIFIHEINFLEIYYGVYREGGLELAQETLSKIKDLPVSIVHGLSNEVFNEAGRLKATYKVSLADSVALAETKVRKCELVTADHHEFDIIDEKKELNFLWIR